MLQLGKKARDKLTGFEGIITGHARHISGCDTYGLIPPVDKDGKIGFVEWFDEGRIEVIGEGIDPASVQVEKNGAGGNPTSHRSHPK